MAERTAAGRDHDLEHFDLGTTRGIGLSINIYHQSTNNSATGSHARNIPVIDRGSNNHIGNDCHDDAIAFSGACMGLPKRIYIMYVDTQLTKTSFITVHEPYLDPGTSNTRELRANSAPLTPTLSRNQATSHSSNAINTPPSFHLRPPFQAPTGRQRSRSALSPSCLQEPEATKPRSSSVSALARSEAIPVDSKAKDAGQCPYASVYAGHPVLILTRPPCVDKPPPHQDVEVQHIHCELEASLQPGRFDSQLLGRVIELSEEASPHHQRTMIVMAICTGGRVLHCLHICHHPGTLSNSAELYGTHVTVVGNPQAEDLVMPGDVAVILDHPELHGLITDCYINYQHMWMVPEDVMFRNIGSVADFQRLKRDFREAQRRLYEDE